MTATDVAPAAAMIVRGNWGDRAGFFEWALAQPSCRPVVAEEDGVVVGTGVGTANGRVGWVGTIFVDAERRGGGLGRALTEAVIDDLETRGCRTQVLIATDAGRRLYERMGFEVLTEQRVFSTPGLGAAGHPVSGDLRPPRPADLGLILDLDAAATGEDRSGILPSLVTPEAARVADTADGRIEGYVARGPWGGAGLVASDPDTALLLLEWRRRRAGPVGRVALAIMEENGAGRDRLLAAGWSESPGPVRMVRGEPLTWRPTWLWGQFTGALG